MFRLSILLKLGLMFFCIISSPYLFSLLLPAAFLKSMSFLELALSSDLYSAFGGTRGVGFSILFIKGGNFSSEYCENHIFLLKALHEFKHSNFSSGKECSQHYLSGHDQEENSSLPHMQGSSN